jgi:hypothetical protein
METISKGNTPMHESLKEQLRLCQQILESILNQAPTRAADTSACPTPYEDDVPSGAD